MCKWGTEIAVNVKIPADLACTGKTYWKEAKIDACIAPLVSALQQGGIDMRGSCCGHGKTKGHIQLQDGRVLDVYEKENERLREFCLMLQETVEGGGRVVTFQDVDVEFLDALKEGE